MACMRVCAHVCAYMCACVCEWASVYAWSLCVCQTGQTLYQNLKISSDKYTLKCFAILLSGKVPFPHSFLEDKIWKEDLSFYFWLVPSDKHLYTWVLLKFCSHLHGNVCVIWSLCLMLLFTGVCVCCWSTFTPASAVLWLISAHSTLTSHFL